MGRWPQKPLDARPQAIVPITQFQKAPGELGLRHSRPAAYAAVLVQDVMTRAHKLKLPQAGGA